MGSEILEVRLLCVSVVIAKYGARSDRFEICEKGNLDSPFPPPFSGAQTWVRGIIVALQGEGIVSHAYQSLLDR